VNAGMMASPAADTRRDGRDDLDGSLEERDRRRK
jgi:hypothetical protein